MTACDNIYAALVNEYVPPGFRSHVFVMRVIGNWPTANDSPWYKLLTIAYFSLVGLVLPLSQFINIFFAQSVSEAMNYLFLSISCLTAAFKAAVLYWQRDRIRDFFRIHTSYVRSGRYNAKRFDRIVRTNLRAHVLFTAMYSFSWFVFLVQAILAEPEKATWSSTSHLPYDFARNQYVYLAGLTYQEVGAVGICIWCGIEDSFYIASMNMTCGYLIELMEQLKGLGTPLTNGSNRNALFYKDLVECGQRYEDCLM